MDGYDRDVSLRKARDRKCRAYPETEMKMAIRIDVHHHIELGSEVVTLIMKKLDLIQELIVSEADDIVAEIAAKLPALASEVALEVQQLIAAQAAGTLTPASFDSLKAISARISGLTTDLQADNPPTTPPTP